MVREGFREQKMRDVSEEMVVSIVLHLRCTGVYDPNIFYKKQLQTVTPPAEHTPVSINPPPGKKTERPEGRGVRHKNAHNVYGG